MRLCFAVMLAAFAIPCSAQRQLLNPYRAHDAPAAREGNSELLHRLLRGGNLYLNLDDAISLAIDNDLDVEIARYGPVLAASALGRAEAGGPIRGVPSGSAQVSSVDSGLGANGSTAAAGLGNGGNNGGQAGSSGGATVQQIGQVTPNLDPNIQNATAFSHQTQPEANTIVSGTNSLIQAKHTYNTVFQQGLITGGTFQIIDYEQSLKENAPTDVINPAVGPYIDLYLRHSLLQGFGIALNDRFIRIAKMNLAGAREAFRSQLLDTVANVINDYWDLSVADDEVKARREALGIAEKFLRDTEEQVRIGSLARVEIPRAQAEVAARTLDLEIAQSAVKQRGNTLKAAISRNEDPALEAAGIVTLDRIVVPEADDLPPLRDLVATALAERPDVAIAKIRAETADIAALGTVNPLLPSLNVTVQAFNRGSAGTYQKSSGVPVNPFFSGAYGRALGQILRRDFPSESASITFFAPLGNRQAQADYGIDQLQLRQSAVSGRRDTNAIVVAISNQSVALRQARARYTAAAGTRALEQELLKAEQQKFSFGKSSSSNIIIAQRALVTAQTSELNALAAYARARVALDSVLGRTLETNHVNWSVR